MTSRFFILIITCLLSGHAYTQAQWEKAGIDNQFKDTFSFTKKWDYSWELSKDPETGKFTKNDNLPVTAADTAHLFFTADCETNVQGGYKLRYCFTQTDKNNIVLTFTDGLPAYASNFYIYYINPDSFSFRPMTIYPSWSPGEKITHRIITQKLTLQKDSYLPGDIIMGHIDVEFIEDVSIPGKPTHSSTYYFRGHFKTVLKKETGR